MKNRQEAISDMWQLPFSFFHHCYEVFALPVSVVTGAERFKCEEYFGERKPTSVYVI